MQKISSSTISRSTSPNIAMEETSAPFFPWNIPSYQTVSITRRRLRDSIKQDLLTEVMDAVNQHQQNWFHKIQETFRQELYQKYHQEMYNDVQEKLFRRFFDMLYDKLYPALYDKLYPEIYQKCYHTIFTDLHDKLYAEIREKITREEGWVLTKDADADAESE